MDTVQIGKFIAQLRKRENLTQEALGEKLGVTNKTVSRWENGNYLPDIETFQLLSEVFGVSINELLAGRKLTDGELREQADKNLVSVAKDPAFSRAERERYWKKKWRAEHIGLLIVCFLPALAALCAGIITRDIGLFAVAGLLVPAGYGYQNNRMMAYVEGKLYDK